MWMCAIPKRFKNVNLIFPTKQAGVYNLIDTAKKDPNIVKIIIFGSATRASCHLWSDIDVYFEMKENKEMPAIASSEEAYDKWNNFTVDESLYSEIMNEGVVVYER